MKQITSVEYRLMLERFSHWLELQGYSASTVYGWPRYVREFLAYVEHRGKGSLSSVVSDDLRAYQEYLSGRGKLRGSGVLSSSSLLNHHQALVKFSEYVRKSGRGHLEVRYSPVAVEPRRPVVLSESEVRSLYQACDVGTALGQRDRAMLSIYYGCGLRRSEGAALDVTDILMNEQMVYVRKGKNYRERYVPLSGWAQEHLQEYLDHWRGAQPGEQGLFVSARGVRVRSESLYLRLRSICRVAGVGSVGLHSLRHSLATHLLHRGMPVGQISGMLGHKSMESTQLYTHLEYDSEVSG